MERKCADVLKEALILHTREINDLMHDAENWKQKFDSQQTHKIRLLEECKTLENKTISLQTTIDSLKEQISDLKQSHRESSGLGCRMCDHLQRMNDSVTEAYSNNLREKDRRISDLENQLFENTKNSSSEKAWNLSNKTPHKPRSQGKDYLDQSLQSESPDSTSRSTPNKSSTHRGDGPRGDHRPSRYSSVEKDKTSTVSPQEDKGPKLRLRSRKRNRYTEDPSPENKRPKHQPKVVLVPETCDPDIITEGEGEEAGGEGECPHREGRVPDTELGTQTSDSESDTVQQETTSRYSLRSSLFSPSSEESDAVLKSPKRYRNEEKKSEKNCEMEAKVALNPNENKIKTDLREALVEGGDGYIQSSPIFQVYKKSNLESPDINRVDTGAESEAESPLLLKVSKNLEDKAKESSPAHTTLFEDDCVGVSPTAVNSSYSRFRSLSQGRQRRKLSQSRISGSEERKKRLNAGETWLNSTKTAVKDSPTLRQSTLSQVFMNIPTMPKAEKSPTTESDDIQKAIELSLRDQGGGRGEQAAQKENLSPFKRPLTPRKCKKSYVDSSKDKRRNRRAATVDCDPDETVPPLCHETAEMSQDPGALLNGSIDPVVQLSVLCDSQSLKTDDLPDLESPVGGDRTESLNSQSQIGDLADFSIADLRKSSNPLTSTCIDVEDPPHSVEEDSQSIPSSIKFGDGKRKQIRIPENLPEDPDSERLIPNHEDSFDRVPGKKQPDFAHVDVVRKQDERRRLPAHKCEECREYYEGMGLSEEELQQRIQTCSRHRAKHTAPGTPEHFWDIGMEDTLECEERGYINTKDPDEGKPRFRRKRQLNKMFKSKKEEEEQEVM